MIYINVIILVLITLEKEVDEGQNPVAFLVKQYNHRVHFYNGTLFIFREARLELL